MRIQHDALTPLLIDQFNDAMCGSSAGTAYATAVALVDQYRKLAENIEETIIPSLRQGVIQQSINTAIKRKARRGK